MCMNGEDRIGDSSSEITSNCHRCKEVVFHNYLTGDGRDGNTHKLSALDLHITLGNLTRRLVTMQRRLAVLCRIFEGLYPARKKRRTIGNVVNSVMLYGIPIWRTALSRIIAIQRRVAFRIISAYSTEAALVLTGIPSIEIRAD